MTLSVLSLFFMETTYRNRPISFLVITLIVNCSSKISRLSHGEPIRDEYVDKPVRFDNMAIFPGSTVVLDDNPLSIASYIEDHPDVLSSDHHHSAHPGRRIYLAKY